MKFFQHHPVEGMLDGQDVLLRQRLDDDGDVVLRISRDQWLAVSTQVDRVLKVRKSDKVEGSLDGFDAFWAAYPRREAKANAESAWRKTNASAHLQMILDHLDTAIRSKQWQEGFVPHASTYLTQRRYLDVHDQPSVLDGVI